MQNDDDVFRLVTRLVGCVVHLLGERRRTGVNEILGDPLR